MTVTFSDVPMGKADKESMEQQMRYLLEVYKKQTKLTKEQIHRFFGEWKAIATRISVGGPMLDNLHPIREESQKHAEDMYKLYTFLLKMLGIYDLFFEKMFEDRPDSLQRAKSQIIITAKGEA